MNVFTGTSRKPKVEDGETTVFTRGLVNRFIVTSIKAPLMGLLNLFVEHVPEPTKENTRWKNTDILIELRDKFFELDNLPSRDKALRAIWNFAIILYDYDPVYQHRMDWLVEQFFKRYEDWEPREPNRPRPPEWREFEQPNQEITFSKRR